MEIKTFGEHAIWVKVGSDISTETHAQVMSLQKSLAPKVGNGITYFIPAYHSLTIGLDLDKISQKALIYEISSLPTNVDTSSNKGSRKISIPTCYSDSFALDLNEISALLNLSKNQIVKLHSSNTYNVFMLGFLPGFPYMGITDKNLNIKRKASPRIKVPMGSVGLAGRQTGIYPSDSPGGWQIIGRTPIPIFNPDRKEPFLLQAGDRVSFVPIDTKEYQRIQVQIEIGEYSFSALIEEDA